MAYATCRTDPSPNRTFIPDRCDEPNSANPFSVVGWFESGAGCRLALRMLSQSLPPGVTLVVVRPVGISAVKEVETFFGYEQRRRRPVAHVDDSQRGAEPLA